MTADSTAFGARALDILATVHGRVRVPVTLLSLGRRLAAAIELEALGQQRGRAEWTDLARALAAACWAEHRGTTAATVEQLKHLRAATALAGPPAVDVFSLRSQGYAATLDMLAGSYGASFDDGVARLAALFSAAEPEPPLPMARHFAQLAALVTDFADIVGVDRVLVLANLVAPDPSTLTS